MKPYSFSKECDPGPLHEQLVAASFQVIGVTYDSGRNQTIVMLEDSEMKDPTSIVDSYVYVVPVYPDYPVLYSTAQATVNNSIAQYNAAVTAYTTALAAWNGASTTNAKLTASEQQIAACASAIQAAAASIDALVNVVTVLAQNQNLTK